MGKNYEFPDVSESDLIYENEDSTPEITENSYWQGIAEQMIKKGLERKVLKKPALTKKHKKKRKKKRERIVPDITYEHFHGEAIRLSRDRGADTEDKRILMMKYFPEKFGEEGEIPACNMGYMSVWNTFNNLVDYAKERINQ